MSGSDLKEIIIPGRKATAVARRRFDLPFWTWEITVSGERFTALVEQCMCDREHCAGSPGQGWRFHGPCAKAGKLVKQQDAHRSDYCHGVSVDSIKKLMNAVLRTYH